MFSLKHKLEDPVTATLAAIGGGSVAGGVAVVGTVAGTVGSIHQGRKSAKSQKRSLAAQQRMADIRNARERRNAYRKAAAARAQATAAGVSSGADLGSSAVTGAQSSIGSQLASNMSFLDALGAEQANVTAANQDAAGYNQNANTWGAIAGVSGQFGGPDMWKNAFKGNG